MRRATIYFACAVAVAFGIGITYRLTHGLPGPTRVKMGQTFKVTDVCSIKPLLVSKWKNVPTVEIAIRGPLVQTEISYKVGGAASCSRRDGSNVDATVMEITENDVLFSFSPSPYN